MSKKKGKKKSPKNTVKEEPKVAPRKEKNSKEKKTSGSTFLRSSIVAVFFMFGFWYVLAADFHDLNTVQNIVKKINAKDPNVTPEQHAMVGTAQTYLSSKNYAWFHSYKWLYNTHLLQNYKNMARLDTFSHEDIQASKSGSSYQYLRYYILDRTPEDAVILMPDAGDLKLPKDAPANAVQFKDLAGKAWCYYFVYPRMLVYDEYESQDSIGGKKNYYHNVDYKELRKKVTHVAIVNGRGYEHLNYVPQRREPNTVLPIDDPNAPQKTVIDSTNSGQ